VHGIVIKGCCTSSELQTPTGGGSSVR